jgi:hypothetical protein
MLRQGHREGILTKASRAVSLSKGLALVEVVVVVTGFAAQAPAGSSGCIQNGEIVTFDGVASARARVPDASQFAWALNLAQPICMLRSVPFAPGVIREEISALRIIGTPPPLGVPIALTGKLLLERGASDPTLFVALEVIHGRKMGEPGPAHPPPPAVPAPPVSAPRTASPRAPVAIRSTASTHPETAAARCDAPPYGGSLTEFQSFVRRFGRIINPPKILAGICNAKFGHAPRMGLHKLGFTDSKIDSESTEHLAADTIVALKSLVSTIE